MEKKYKLLKDMANLDAGAELKIDKDSDNYFLVGILDKFGVCFFLNKLIVENSPEWFEEIVEEEEERLWRDSEIVEYLKYIQIGRGRAIMHSPTEWREKIKK